MKKLAGIIIFVISAFMAFPQNQDVPTIMISPITGGSSRDQIFFTENLTMEITAAGYSVVPNLEDALYSLTGTLDAEEGETVLRLTLYHVAEDRDLLYQELYYNQPEETYTIMPFLIWSILTNAPPYSKPEEEEEAAP
jgi:hypothetical protein